MKIKEGLRNHFAQHQGLDAEEEWDLEGNMALYNMAYLETEERDSVQKLRIMLRKTCGGGKSKDLNLDTRNDNIM